MPFNRDMDIETWARLISTIELYRESHDQDCTCTPCMDYGVIKHQLHYPAGQRYGSN